MQRERLLRTLRDTAITHNALTKRRRGLPGRFVDEVIDGVGRERSTEVAEAVAAVLGEASEREIPGQEGAEYFALCERAWLRWSRLALDAITTHTLGQVSLGLFNPASVHDWQDASLAELRCGVHLRLLGLACEPVDHEDWPWMMEAARQVHVSTEKALGIAARLRLPEVASVSELYPGISSAADALVTAIAAGFVVDGPTEVLETVTAIVRCGEIEMSPEQPQGKREHVQQGNGVSRRLYENCAEEAGE